MKKEKSKVVFSVLTSIVGICLIFHLLLQARMQTWRDQQANLEFKILDQRMQQTQYMNTGMLLLGNVVKSSQTNETIDFYATNTYGTNVASSFLFKKSNQSLRNIEMLQNKYDAFTKQLYWAKLGGNFLIAIAILLNTYTLYYGVKIIRLYKT